MSNNRNPVAIIVPCHRVIAASGSLCGYGGGLDIKRQLLDLERANAARTNINHSAVLASVESVHNRGFVGADVAAHRVLGYGPGPGGRGVSCLSGSRTPAPSRIYDEASWIEGEPWQVGGRLRYV